MDFEESISFVLRAGVVSSMLLILTGFIMLVYSESTNQLPNAAAILNMNSRGISLQYMINGLTSGSGICYIILGIIVLMATPVARVIMSVVLFAFKKDLLYTTITIIVMLSLLIAIFVIPHFIGSLHVT